MYGRNVKILIVTVTSLLEGGLKREMSPSLTNGSTGNGIDEDDGKTYSPFFNTQK